VILTVFLYISHVKYILLSVNVFFEKLIIMKKEEDREREMYTHQQ
jgi:hypothetical protein